METKRYNHPADKSDAQKPSSFGPGAAGSERFTVLTLEEDLRRRQSRESRPSRPRRSRRHQENTSGKLIWISMAGVALVYLAFLAFSAVWPRVKDKLNQSTAAPVAKPAETAQPEKAPPPTSEAPNSELPSAAEIIAGVKKAQQLADEGRRMVRARQFEQAAAKFEAAALLAPHVFSNLMDWSNVLREQKRWAAARDVLARALAISPDSAPARLALAQLYHQLLQNEDALTMARWVLESEPYSEPAHQIAADVYTSMNQHREAVEHWQKLVALDSNNHAVENNLGVAYLKLGQTALALKTFENVIRDEPSNSQAHYFMVLCFIQKQEPELAVDVLVRASTRFGHQFVAAWTRSSDFDDLRDLPMFKQHFADAPATTDAGLDTQP